MRNLILIQNIFNPGKTISAACTMVSIEKRKEVGCVISQAMLTKDIDMLFSASHGNGDSKHAIAKSIPSRTKATMFYYSKVNRLCDFAGGISAAISAPLSGMLTPNFARKSRRSDNGHSGPILAGVTPKNVKSKHLEIEAVITVRMLMPPRAPTRPVPRFPQPLI